ncbi:effector-associated constant component EACC1 [Sphaerisporangium siamense]|uniref:Uncharacterized protein n=1 Tax=Sphaerisporangium siamense TaxID=795645 RepID=A0A7W7DGI7_9ACTN|nr:hypothetical protein [Sphaerisporangium siamense]MBB4704928.1 hypothetical protein [Sphaerisporangium siamense]
MQGDSADGPVFESMSLAEIVHGVTAVGGPAAVAGVLIAWLRHRKSKVILKITKKDGSNVEIHIEGPADPNKLARTLSEQFQEARSLEVEEQALDPVAEMVKDFEALPFQSFESLSQILWHHISKLPEGPVKPEVRAALYKAYMAAASEQQLTVSPKKRSSGTRRRGQGDTRDQGAASDREPKA